MSLKQSSFLTEVDICLCDEPRLVIRIQCEGVGHQLFDRHSHSFHVDCLYAGRHTQTSSSHFVALFQTSSKQKKRFLLWKSRWPDGEVFGCHFIYNIILKKEKSVFVHINATLMPFFHFIQLFIFTCFAVT